MNTTNSLRFVVIGGVAAGASLKVRCADKTIETRRAKLRIQPGHRSCREGNPC
jgi:hypothetical protein